ncbi:MAG: NAD(P)/FAD-dependent oxidoreductase [Micromonosporaceae bacterium]
MTEVDILIIGAGPVGLYAAYYAGFRELSTAVMDSLPEPGGQVSALYPEKLIHDIAGLPQVRGRDLVENLLAQSGQFSPVFLLGQVAAKLEQQRDGRLLVTSSAGAQVSCRAIVISGGIGTFHPRPLPVGGEYEGLGLSYFVPDPAEHAGRDVVVVGGGDSALDWALTLHPIARTTTLVHRRDAFRGHEHSVRKVREAGVEVLTPYQVSGVRGGGWVDSVEITRVRGGESRVLRCQSVVAALGFTADLGPLQGWGLDIQSRRIHVNSQMQTNLPMVYAAGDIADYAGKVRLIAVGFGEAAIAVNNAAVAIDPTLDLFPGHSTDTAA